MTGHHEHDEDTTMPPQPAPGATETFPRPRVRLRDTRAGAGDEPTRLDVHRAYDVPDPTREVRVSPIGVHTRGSAATTPPPPSRPAPAAVLDALLDDRDRIRADAARIDADTRRVWKGRSRKVRTVREEAARRAAEKLRHERTLERIETAQAGVKLAIMFCLLVIVVGAGVVCWGILDGWFAWELVRTP